MIDQNKIEEIITNYICYHAKKKEYDRIYDVEKLMELLEENEIVYHYESPADPVWSWNPLSNDNGLIFDGNVAEANFEILFDMIHYPPTFQADDSND